jgi:8-oxo-dGTP pyrophosphatase MutT (NUDIX family)
MWQFIPGSGEDGETPKKAAVREAQEEALVPAGVKGTALDPLATVPRNVLSRLHALANQFVRCARERLRVTRRLVRFHRRFPSVNAKFDRRIVLHEPAN